jgi:putative transposase
MKNEAQPWTAAAYIARNPVAAGMCASAVEWPWSSHRAIVDGADVPWLDHGRLLSYYEPLGGEPRRRYEEVVERGDLSTIAALGSETPRC